MDQQTPLDVRGAVQDPRWNQRVEGDYSFPVESVLALQLEGDEEALGAIALFSKRGGRAFTEEDLSLLRLVSANVSTAVRLFRASQARERGERLTTIGRLAVTGHPRLQDADDRDQRLRAADAGRR